MGQPPHSRLKTGLSREIFPDVHLSKRLFVRLAEAASAQTPDSLDRSKNPSPAQKAGYAK
ncbi:hypothetical protein TRIP_B200498 [uncultured Desulfatiglans sp.]|uniref:Uncharacterized protein n=1 Tax=Uncultured Desulfatiglans sp. TaxID=1748965 RepID=A0A653A350_UNCDX|nr:hypothetical protein TRIP_B200498 [uncultured Desulfatiglans sp.]